MIFIVLRASAETLPGPMVAPPEVAQRVDATYPPEALVTRREGTVVLFVTIETDGSVGTATVAESAGEAFDQAALTAIKQWKFSPARRGDQAIASRIRVPFTFLPPAPAPEADNSAALAAQPQQPVVAAAAARPPEPAGTLAPENLTQPPPAAAPRDAPTEITVAGRMKPPSRGASDYQVTVGHLSAVPHQDAADVLKLAPGILLTNEGGEGHAEQVFLRGFDAREGQTSSLRSMEPRSTRAETCTAMATQIRTSSFPS
jgi:TonB family protein